MALPCFPSVLLLSAWWKVHQSSTCEAGAALGTGHFQPSSMTEEWGWQPHSPHPLPSPRPHPHPPHPLAVPSATFLPLASSKLWQGSELVSDRLESELFWQFPLWVFCKEDHGYTVCPAAAGFWIWGPVVWQVPHLPDLFPPSWHPQLTRPLVRFFRLGISSSKSSSSFPSSTFSSFSKTLWNEKKIEALRNKAQRRKSSEGNVVFCCCYFLTQWRCCHGSASKMLARSWGSWLYWPSLPWPFQPSPPRTPTFSTLFAHKVFYKREYSSKGTLLCRPMVSCQTFSSVQFSHSVVSNSLRPHGLQPSRLPCPSAAPGACSNSCPSSWCCHPTILSSVFPFPSCLQSFPASGSFPKLTLM